tara:strand:+ start:391 stop:1032 length:642 start_codon:yes stop_codon:yes gene_type:complete
MLPTENMVKSAISFYRADGGLEKHRRNLPHWQQDEVWVYATWRLADSIPQSKLNQWKVERSDWMSRHPEPWDETTESEYHERFSQKIDEWLDKGMGSCVLRDSRNAKIVAWAIRHFDDDRYRIASFVVIPNHVHVLIQPKGDNTVSKILKSWKGFTAREINRRLGSKGTLWQNEYWDRLIRSERHFFKVLEYIRENPTKAKLAQREYIFEERE